MIKMRWKSDLSKLSKKERAVASNAAASAREAAELYREEIRARWTKPGPSVPGEPPAMDTHNLDESIFVEKQGRDPLGRFAGKDAAIYHVKIQTSAGPRPGKRGEYAGILEYGMDRPFIDAAADAVTALMPHIFRNVYDGWTGSGEDFD